MQLAAAAQQRLDDDAGALHRDVSLARLAGGTYVSAWAAASTTSPAAAYQVCFERLDASGSRAGANACVAGAQAADQATQVLPRPDGGFVVVWADASDASVRSQAFDAAGHAVGGIQAGPQQPVPATAAALASGGYVALVPQGGGQGTTASTISFLRYASDGTPLGAPVSVGDSGGLSGAKIVPLRGGGFAVAWVQGASAPAVLARMFTAQGTAVGGAVPVSGAAPVCRSGGCEYQVLSGLAPMDDGGYAVAWMNGFGMGQITGTYARRFQPDGTPGAVVGKLDEGIIARAAMAPNGPDGFVIAWSDTSASDILARVVDATPLR